MTGERAPYVDPTGVVDPLRIPPPVHDAARAAGRLPLLGRVFVVLAIVDAGFEAATPGVNLLEPRWLVGTIGRALVVALPAAVLFRRRDAFAASRSVLVGTVLVALGILAPVAERSIASLLPIDPLAPFEPGNDPIRVAIGLVLIALPTFGWLYVAAGLDSLRDGERSSRGLGAVLALVMVVAIAVPVARSLPMVVGTPEPYDSVGLVLGLLGSATGLAFAYLAWVVGGQAGLPPRAATLVGALAIGIVVAATVIFATNAMLLEITRGGDGAMAFQSVALPVAGMLTAVGYAGLFAAFLLGLADPPRDSVWTA